MAVRRRGGLPLSLILLIRDDDLLRCERAAVRWLSRYTAADRQLRFGPV
jgi:hypothetical protein